MSMIEIAFFYPQISFPVWIRVSARARTSTSHFKAEIIWCSSMHEMSTKYIGDLLQKSKAKKSEHTLNIENDIARQSSCSVYRVVCSFFMFKKTT